MIPVINLYFLIIAGLLFWYLWSRRKYYYLSWKMNSVLGLPFIGVALNVTKQENILSYITETRKNMDVRVGIVWFGPTPVIYISEPELMKKVFQSSTFVNKADFYDIVTKHFGEGLFSSKAPIWNRHRKLIEPAFHGNLLKDFTAIFNEESKFLMNKLETHLNGKEFYLLPILQLCFLDIAAQTTMGKRMKFQENQNVELADAYCSLFKLTATRIFNPLYTFDFIFNLSRWGAELKQSKEIVHKFIFELIQHRFNYKEKESVASSTEESDVYDKEGYVKSRRHIFMDLAIEHYKNKQLTWEDVEHESNIILTSASESSAGVACNAIIMLAMFPEYQERLFEEIYSEFPEKKSVISQESVQKLPYLEMVICESMRLLAPIPLVGRTAVNDFQLSDDIVIPKGTQVLIDIFNTQRDTIIWGPDAETYNPEHFAPENLKDRHPFAYAPFAKGVRQCIGSRYAMLGMKIILSKIIRQFRFTTDFKFEDLRFVENVGLKFFEDPSLRIYEREH